MERLYWLWLTLKPRMNSTKITCLMERFESIEDIYRAKEYNNIQILTPNEKQGLLDKNLGEAKRVCENAQKCGAEIITFDDKNYPEPLRRIIDPPYVLYAKGTIPDWNELFMIGVVGTRRYSDYGRMVTMNLCRDLAKYGVTVVSGMAKGIDAIAAEAALRVGKSTIAVLGSGIDVIYPAVNTELYYSIIENGVILTEYPPGVQALPHHFPERNRIIAGLSRGLLVTEAPKGSGALITAECAFKNNRDVFAVPGNIFDEHYKGSNELIQKCAKLVMSAEDIIIEYPYDAMRLKKETVSAAAEKPIITIPHKDDSRYEKLNDKEKRIIDLLTEKERYTDELIRETDMSAGELNTTMILLEMKGFVVRLPGNSYKLKM